ncbi:MAG: type VI secretion system baseplate subunit TssF [Gemmatimonadetes bacterium]|nr:type VI secretion system baseplate subunit TssF [Gemmatimonadota bacterium]NNF38040.1 type VI secretion system baseplate subunit TssF [Gemmatimonadota bacterium]
MSDDLLDYYEAELSFLRRSGADFARRYPQIASRLQLEASKCDDPHVERLLEGAAFLAGRIHRRLDEDAPALSEALLSVSYPQHVRPIPSMALVQLHLDPDQGQVSSGLEVPKGTALFSHPVDGVPCRFRTGFDTVLWPLSVTEAAWVPVQGLGLRAGRGVVGGIKLRIDASGVPVGSLGLDRLRIFLHGDGSLPYMLYELLLSRAEDVVLRPADGSDLRRPGALEPVGFEPDEGLLPHPHRSFLPYRHLQEYFAFPEKYLFLDLVGLEAIRGEAWGEAFEVVVPIQTFERADRQRTLETGVNPRVFQLGCTPIVNLFERPSEPVLLSHRQLEYPVVADARRRATTRIYSVEGVKSFVGPGDGRLVFEPLHGGMGARGHTSGERILWHARRLSASSVEQRTSDVAISFADPSARLVRPDLDSVTLDLVCFNGTLPSRLPFGNEEGDFEMAGSGPIERIVTLVKPTAPVVSPLGRQQMWRLISQLAVNYVSLVDDGPAPLQELLRLHNSGTRPGTDAQIRGLVGLEGRPGHARIDGAHGPTFVRGVRVDLTLDEDAFTGGGAYLFASVLDRFLGLSVSVNSFTQVTAHTQQRQSPLGRWPARAGRKVLL